MQQTCTVTCDRGFVDQRRVSASLILTTIAAKDPVDTGSRISTVKLGGDVALLLVPVRTCGDDWQPFCFMHYRFAVFPLAWKTVFLQKFPPYCICLIWQRWSPPWTIVRVTRTGKSHSLRLPACFQPRAQRSRRSRLIIQILCRGLWKAAYLAPFASRWNHSRWKMLRCSSHMFRERQRHGRLAVAAKLCGVELLQEGQCVFWPLDGLQDMVIFKCNIFHWSLVIQLEVPTYFCISGWISQQFKVQWFIIILC